PRPETRASRPPFVVTLALVATLQRRCGSPVATAVGGSPWRCPVDRGRAGVRQVRMAPPSSGNGQGPPVRGALGSARFECWRGQDLNLRPSGYEPDCLGPIA